MTGFYKVVTDGVTFRIVLVVQGNQTQIMDIDTGKALEFNSKEKAEKFIHDSLSLSGWHDA